MEGHSACWVDSKEQMRGSGGTLTKGFQTFCSNNNITKQQVHGNEARHFETCSCDI